MDLTASLEPSANGRDGAGSGRWAPTPGYFSSCGADTSVDPADGARE